MEGMKVVLAKIGVFIHPSRAANVQQGVHEILNSLLLKYSEEFEGVILAYLKPKIIGKSGRILAGLTPYFHVDLTAKLLIFSPSPEMLIEGKVNKIEKDYIGVVVLGLFNAAIGVSDIREDLYYDQNPHGREWVSESDGRHSIRLGSIIRFSVKSLQETEHIIDLCGSLANPKTGCVNWIELPPVTPRKKLTKNRSANGGGRKHETQKELSNSRSSTDVNHVETMDKRTGNEQDVLNSHETPRSKDVGRKEKTAVKEKDPLETPDVHRQKHVDGQEESMRSMLKDSEMTTVSTVSSGHKHKKRKEMEQSHTPDEIHHKRKKKRKDAVETQ